ncbi:c-type cytochrome [Mucilaginibacter dorajii]|uniref:Photosynthetic reaction center cytochrome c subunit n=1 Tax=Mucilaginibacter dorajii TaxID=692994 RepID=A0ABP7PNJ6_9SPHI|nr:c-type cytochrome [Mucilaginibacter dorajii]MCS3736346.1 cytochrome c553 [Mucilaginibacter dorajii]
MKINRKLKVIVVLAAVVSITAGATINKPGPRLYTNLKVLPKNITSKELQGIMADDFEDGLGVSCGFCHAANKDGHGLDFASDAKPEKEIARAMMRMTLGINKKYLKLKHPKIGDATLVVSCTTCHKGQAFPDGTEPK